VSEPSAESATLVCDITRLFLCGKRCLQMFLEGFLWTSHPKPSRKLQDGNKKKVLTYSENDQ